VSVTAVSTGARGVEALTRGFALLGPVDVFVGHRRSLDDFDANPKVDERERNWLPSLGDSRGRATHGAESRFASDAAMTAACEP